MWSCILQDTVTTMELILVFSWKLALVLGKTHRSYGTGIFHS